jgi:serine/threonine-protein kinase
VLTREPIPPSRLQPKVPRDLDTICLKGLRKEPAQRYSSAGALADELQRWLDGRPILARPVSGLERSVKWIRRNPERALLIGLGVAAAAGVLAWQLWSLFR